MNLDPVTLLSRVVQIAEQAGHLILSLVKETDSIDVRKKTDRTPVTAIDIATNRFIVEQLSALTADVLIVSEEENLVLPAGFHPRDDFWLVDPLDGTKGFIVGSPQYTVNIALIRAGYPILGVIYAPALSQLYFAYAGGPSKARQGVIESSNAVVKATTPWRVVVSQFHNLDKLMADTPQYIGTESAQINSSLKFCVVAAGEYDLYPRLGRTSLWDTAAGQIILEQAGGAVVDFNGKRLQYNLESGLLNPDFMAVGDRRIIPDVRQFHANRRRPT